MHPLNHAGPPPPDEVVMDNYINPSFYPVLHLEESSTRQVAVDRLWDLTQSVFSIEPKLALILYLKERVLSPPATATISVFPPPVKDKPQLSELVKVQVPNLTPVSGKKPLPRPSDCDESSSCDYNFPKEAHSSAPTKRLPPIEPHDKAW